MPERLEKQEEQKFYRKVVSELSVASIKLNLQGNRGWPDRMFLLPLRPAFIEFKRKGEYPYPLQLYRIQQLTNLGYDVLWTSDYDLAFKWIANLLAARVSEASNKVDDWTGVRGLVPRPRSGKDKHQSSSK